ncbi:hypothetical protein ACR8KE_000521 [Vibrio vulnificus]
MPKYNTELKETSPYERLMIKGVKHNSKKLISLTLSLKSQVNSFDYKGALETLITIETVKQESDRFIDDAKCSYEKDLENCNKEKESEIYNFLKDKQRNKKEIALSKSILNNIIYKIAVFICSVTMIVILGELFDSFGLNITFSAISFISTIFILNVFFDRREYIHTKEIISLLDESMRCRRLIIQRLNWKTSLLYSLLANCEEIFAELDYVTDLTTLKELILETLSLRDE